MYYLCAAKQAVGSTRSLVLGIPDPAAPRIVDESSRRWRRCCPMRMSTWVAQATSEVLREKGLHSRYIHIATHGWFRQDNPMFSSIRLGGSN